jgi:hypothetical protein
MRPQVPPRRYLWATGLLVLLLSLALTGGSPSFGREQRVEAKRGPLRVFRANPRYFADATGKPVYLTGSHVWWNLVGATTWNADCRYGPPRPFSYQDYLNRLSTHGHNFIRLWTLEQTSWRECGEWISVAPHPWERTGPGMGHDDLPKFDLRRLNDAYFRRLRSRVAEAQRRNIYVSVMLFEGFGTAWLEHAWRFHPLNGANNINGVDADVNSDGKGVEVHTLANPAVTRLQERYVRRVIDTVNSFDNVLYEIANEPGARSVAWQYHMLRIVRSHQARKGKRHPTGMTLAAPDGWNDQLYRSSADWISPGGRRFLTDPPAAPQSKVSIVDTDHVCGVCGGWDVVWKNFTRGHNVIFMDPQDSAPERVVARWAMSHTRRYAQRMNLARALPHPELASSRFCLADPGREFLVYQPGGGELTVDLSRASGRLTGEWLSPITGRATPTSVEGGKRLTLSPPFSGAAVLYLRKGR